MTLNEIADEILMGLDRWDDDDLKEMVKFSFRHHAARFISQEIDRRGYINPVYYSKPLCATLTVTDIAECCTTESGCDVLVSATLPKPLSISLGLAVSYVGSVNGSIPYQRVTPDQVPYIRYSKYSTSIPRWMWLNNKVYILNSEAGLRKTRIVGAWEDPSTAGNFSSCSGDACYTDDMDYPVSAKIANIVIKDMISGELQLFSRRDPELDNNDHIEQNE